MVPQTLSELESEAVQVPLTLKGIGFYKSLDYPAGMVMASLIVRGCDCNN